MVDKATTDNEDPKLGSVQAPQEGDTDKALDTPDNDEPLADAAEAPAPEESDHQEDKNPKASKKPGEAKGVKKVEQKAAEEAPADVAPGVMDEDTNPVGQATQHESKDPYAEGKHIANPEPNNGKGEDPEKFDREQEERDAQDTQDAVDQTAQNDADQRAAEAKADKDAEEAAK